MTSVIEPRITASSVIESPAMAAYEPFSMATVRGQRTGVVDPKISEITRLRVARYHDCRICGTARVLEAELDESLAHQIDFFEKSDFPEEWKVALRLTDAIVMQPGEISEKLRDDVRHYFSDAQLSQMLYDIVKWSCNKALVSMRIDTPLAAESGYDDQGHQLWGEDATAEWKRMQAGRY